MFPNNITHSWALNVEWKSGELLEIAIQILFYSSVPNPLNGLKIMKEVFEERDNKGIKNNCD